MTPDEKRAEARRLHETAKRLTKEAHDERPLPDFWRVGQKVRFLRDSEWAWSKGQTATIIALRDFNCRPAREYQVFYTGNPGEPGQWWTTPDDVELAEDVAATTAPTTSADAPLPTQR